jgi:zinc protease
MKVSRLVALVLTALLPAALLAAEPKPLPKELPAFGPDRPLPVPHIVQSTTPEGLRVWIVARPGFPRVTAVLALRGGLAADPRDLPGVSELLAETVKDGTAGRSSRQIAEQLQGIGGEIAATAREDSIFVTADGLARGASQVLAILADVARHAAFPAQEVALAKENALPLRRPPLRGDRSHRGVHPGDHP